MTYRLAMGAVAVLGSMFAAAGSASAQKCSNSAITTAYVTTILRPPSGSGTTGECNPALYGGYASQQDLDRKVVAYANAHGTNGPVAASQPVLVGLKPMRFTLTTYHVDSLGNLLDQNSREIAKAGHFTINASIVAQGGGNIVAQGGGNIVAQGGGNLVPKAGMTINASNLNFITAR